MHDTCRGGTADGAGFQSAYERFVTSTVLGRLLLSFLALLADFEPEQICERE